MRKVKKWPSRTIEHKIKYLYNDIVFVGCTAPEGYHHFLLTIRYFKTNMNYEIIAVDHDDHTF